MAAVATPPLVIRGRTITAPRTCVTSAARPFDVCPRPCLPQSRHPPALRAVAVGESTRAAFRQTLSSSQRVPPFRLPMRPAHRRRALLPPRAVEWMSDSMLLARQELAQQRAAEGPSAQGAVVTNEERLEVGEEESEGGNIRTPTTKSVLLQAFNWESWRSDPPWYDGLMARAAEMAGMGFTDVWLPPPTKAVDKQGYLPSQLYNLDASRYGDEVHLRRLIRRLHSLGMRCMADIVINHRCGDFQDAHGNWTIFEGGTPDERLDWGPWAITAGDMPYGGDGKADTGEDYGAAPDIDHTNARVQRDLINWLLWMKREVGFDGWRFDFAKGYGAEFVGMYCRATEPVLAVGEVWTAMRYEGDGQMAWNQDAHRQALVDWVDGTGGVCGAFDFTTKGILQQAVQGQLWRLKDGQGKPPGMIGYWPARAVTFIDNHDTGSTQNSWPFPSDKVMQGYAYILTHPGIPCVFYDHVFTWGLKKPIVDLVAVRQRNGIRANSPIRILAAEANLYVAEIGAGKRGAGGEDGGNGSVKGGEEKGGKIMVKIGSQYDMGRLLPSNSEYRVATYGDGYCVWESTA
ncbi:hypothetical protein CLOM_g6219 [Closterium sp. NIES-68]|nr:hypothetical protein CLOM_g6219 [Closterium sp. NIES-68]GJP62065.1 hypothetical protein CLOP_g19166 [Closterium sp. NIES-67]